MILSTSDADAPQDDHRAVALSISDVSRVLQVPVPTLRSWELRYGIPQSDRTAGSHRRYDQGHLHALRLMRDQIAGGQRAHTAASSVRAHLGLTAPNPALIAQFLHAARSGDPAQVRTVLQRSVSTVGLGACIDDVLMPAMHQIGVRGQSGPGDLPDAHLITEAARGWLNCLAAHAPAPRHREQVLLACESGDLQTVGLEALAVLLRYRHRICRVLGARIPPTALLSAARGSETAGVVIVCHLGTARHRAADCVRTVAHAGIEVFYTGNAFTQPRHRTHLPGHYLENNLQLACAQIEDHLQVPTRR